MSKFKKRGNSASPNLRAPSKQGLRLSRSGFGLILCLLIPPLGLLFLWRQGVFRVRGRLLLTIISTLEMALVLAMMIPESVPATVSPVPELSVRVTPAPESDVKTALSNIEDILYQQQLEEVIAQGGTEEDLMTDEEKLAQQEAEQEEILNTIVYSVNSGAKYYHASQVCGNQSNRVSMTLLEAMHKGLGACPDCDPPVYGQVISNGTVSTNTSEDGTASATAIPSETVDPNITIDPNATVIPAGGGSNG